MIKGNKSFELLPVESRFFLQDLGLDVIEVKRLTNDKKLLFLIETSKGQFVLKVNLPPSNFVGKLRSKIIGSLGFKQECQFYKNIKNTKSNGKYPKYVGSDKNNLLIEYIPKNDFEIKNLEPTHWYLVGQVLGLFNRDTKLFTLNIRSYVHKLFYGPEGAALFIGIPTVRKALGLKVSIRYLFEILRCKIKQNKLSITVLLHNDFLLNNFIFSNNYNSLTIIDFQDSTIEKKWPLYDLVRLLMHLKHSINQDDMNLLIRGYINNMPGSIFDEIKVEDQVRFCVLRASIQSLGWRLNNGYDYSDVSSMLKALLYDRILDDYCKGILKSIRSNIYQLQKGN